MSTTTINNTTENLFNTLRQIDQYGWLGATVNEEDSMEFKNIEDYNDYLVNGKILKTVVEYIENVNNRFWHYDMSFMSTFMSYVKRHDFCIPHTWLKEYGVVASLERSNDIKKCLDKNFLVEGKDYRLRHKAQPVPQGGFSTKNVYTLTPKAFKMCLIRSKNIENQKYANYYLALEDAIVYYNEYQLALSQRYILIMENRVQMSEEGLTMLKHELEENRRKSEEEKQLADERYHQDKARQEQINNILLERYNQEHLQKEQVEAHVQEIVPDRVMRPDDGEKCGSFVLMKIDEDKFYAIRCQKRCAKQAIKKLETKYPGAEVWMCIDYHPNPVKFWNVIKKRIAFISVRRNMLTLDGSEVALRAAIQ